MANLSSPKISLPQERPVRHERPVLQVLVDVSPMVYRCYHILPEERRPSLLSVLTRHLESLNKRIAHMAPSSYDVIFALDSVPLHRKKVFPAYKAHRAPMEPAILSCFKALPNLLARMGQTALKEEGHEADDIIATLACSGERQKRKTLIVSPDKDLLQLVGEYTSLCQRYDLTGVIFTPRDVFVKYNVYPKSIVDWLALCGDVSDNIVGVPGIGPQRASRLLASMGSLEMILLHPTQIPKKYVRFDIPRYEDRLRLNQRIIALETHLSLGE